MNSKKLQKIIGLILIPLIIIASSFSIYYLFFYAKVCDSGDCFSDALNECKRVSWIREDARASWLYNIEGKSEKNSCEIKVKLLIVKEGTIANEKLQDKEMICIVPKTSTKFPEEDISKCSGLLKEELQNIIIQKMHNYLLENVGEIKQGFESF